MEHMAQELDDKERMERMAARSQKQAIKGPPGACPQTGGPLPPAAQEDQGDEMTQPPAAQEDPQDASSITGYTGPTQEEPHNNEDEDEENPLWRIHTESSMPVGKSGRPIWPRHLKPMYPGCMDDFSIEDSSEEEPEWTTQVAADPTAAQLQLRHPHSDGAQEAQADSFNSFFAQEQEKEKEKGKRLQEEEEQAKKHQKAMGKGKGKEAPASTTGPGAKMSDE